MAPARLLTNPGTPVSSSEHSSPTEAFSGNIFGASEIFDHSDKQRYYDPFESPFSGISNSPLSTVIDGLPKARKDMPIAIIGMSVRAGAATTPDEFYEMLSRGRTAWSSEFPKERFHNSSFYHPNPGKLGCINTNGASFIKQDIKKFDAPFFSLTELEAISMDPQQRLLLECAFEALDSAGIQKHSTIGKDIGVFVGAGSTEYEYDLFRDSDSMPMFQATGNALALQSNRISHFFDWRGPSVTIDTACSASLTATHYGCQSIRSGESNMALVGGCNLNIIPEFFINFSTSRLFGNEGRSFSFDQRGTGYGRGEGCGMILLKPLDQALKDNDCIRAVIAASGVNQDGRTPGITMPSGESQEALMKAVYKNAGLNPAETGYVEAHGTGTRVGDPIEVGAINRVFGGKDRTIRNPLWLGSVKSNIGHVGSASGILAVIKAAMMLERGFILPNYDFKTGNPKIPFAKWGIKVPTLQRPWPKGKRFASVNNFGFGGTNAHLVLEKAPFVLKPAPIINTSVQVSKKLFVLSANDKITCQSLMKNLGVYLEQRPEMFQRDLLNNIAYTLGQRRSLLSWRVAIPSSESFDLVRKLNAESIIPIKEGGLLRLGFVFTGQGAQWWAMGRELYHQYPIFTYVIDATSQVLAELGAPYSLVDELNKDEGTTLVNDAHISQPACTAVQLGLVELLKSWGVQPDAVVGHSSGEIGAAYAAGILSIKTAMTIAYHRGRLVPVLKQRFPELKGTMMAVGCGKEEIDPLIAQLTAEEVRIACYNSPQSLTISGDEPAIVELQQLLEERQIFNRKLVIETAYHSHHMELIANDYMESLRDLPAPMESSVRFHSSLTGKDASWEDLTPSYWVQNLTSSVKFAQVLSHMVAPIDEYKTGVDMLIELGPHSALQGPIKQTLTTIGGAAAKIAYAPSLLRKKDAVDTALDLASTLFCRGAKLDFEYINFPKVTKMPSLLIDLPKYPWNHSTSYWHESRISQKQKTRSAPRHDILGTLANYSNDLEPTWRNVVRSDDLSWLRHHKIQSLTLFPISAFVSMALEAASQQALAKGADVEKYELSNVDVQSPLMILDDDIEMTTSLKPLSSSDGSKLAHEFRIHSWSKSKGWMEHCTGTIVTHSHSVNEVDGERHARQKAMATASTITTIKDSKLSAVEQTKLYDSLLELGVSYGPTFQGLANCYANERYSTAQITVNDTSAELPEHFETGYIVHPTFLEQLVELYWPVLGAGQKPLDVICLSASIGKITISAKILELANLPGKSLDGYCTAAELLSTTQSSKVSMFAAAGLESIISIEDLTISPLPSNAESVEIDAPRELCYKQIWEPILEPIKAIENARVDSPQQNSPVLEAIDATPSINFPTNPVVIVHGQSAAQIDLAQKIGASIEFQTGRKPELGQLTDVDADGKQCLLLADLEQPVLSEMTAEHFSAIQRLVSKSEGLLWITRGAYGQNGNPTSGMVTGFSRVVRSEMMVKFATLDLDAESVLDDTSSVAAILKVLKNVMNYSSITNVEMEFQERKGAFYTPRIVDDDAANDFVHKKVHSSTVEIADFATEGRALKLASSHPGQLDALHFVDDDYPDEALAPEEIEIRVGAFGVDNQSIRIALGLRDATGSAGECSGTVTRVGSSVTSFVLGDRVALLSNVSYSTFARANAKFTVKIADSIPLEQAATLPVAYGSAYYSLIDSAQLGDEDSVLVLNGTSAVGQAVISIAQMIGATVFATVEDSQGKDVLSQQYGIPDSHIYYTRNPDLGSLLLQQTAGHGVDVVLDSQPEIEAVHAALPALNSFGKLIFVESGASHGTQSKLDMSKLRSNVSFISIDFQALVTARPKIVKRLMADISKLLQYGKIRPIQGRTSYSISELEKAFKDVQTGKAFGKTIVVPYDQDKVKVLPSNKAARLLKEDATYILIGGTGGLGRSMTKWMAGKGAKNIVLVSRSGSVAGAVKVLVDDMKTIGVNVVVRSCNVAKKQEVETLIRSQLNDLPPIKGVVHGAMVLKDCLFEKQFYGEYLEVIESKVAGAWNFHHALQDKPLDFFVFYSSASAAFGGRGQAAYAAANSFLDSFAQYRRSLGLPGTSMGLTAVSDVGFLAEHTERRAEIIKNIGSDTICEAEVLALFEAAIDGTSIEHNNGHNITGVRLEPTNMGFWATDAKFKHLRIAAEAAAAEVARSNGDKPASWNAAVKSAASLPDAEKVVCDGLVEKIATILSLEMEEMDPTRSLSSYALDSLTAIDVRNFITREFQASLQVLELLSSGTIETLAKGVCKKSKLVNF